MIPLRDPQSKANSDSSQITVAKTPLSTFRTRLKTACRTPVFIQLNHYATSTTNIEKIVEQANILTRFLILFLLSVIPDFTLAMSRMLSFFR